jgi:uncharacterized glyoxalase superfamily protein PhnB
LSCRGPRLTTRARPPRSAKGATGFSLGLRTDDLQGTYEDLKAKGVEFTDEPTDRFYGIDCGLRDPFGNHLRLVQPHAEPRQVDPAEFAGS